MTNEWFFSNGQTYKGEAPKSSAATATISYVDICPRCNGTGTYPSIAWQGRCLKCNSAGRVKITARIYTGEALSRLQEKRQKRDAAKSAKLNARLAAKALELESIKAQFNAQHPGFIDSIKESKNPFLADLTERFNSKGTLTEGQVEAAKAALERLAIEATKPNEHVGSVGERLDVPLTVTNVFVGESQFGTYWLVSFEDTQGRAFLWRASSGTELAKGDAVTGKGIVKEHGEYKGRKQTVLTRCKLNKL